MQGQFQNSCNSVRRSGAGFCSPVPKPVVELHDLPRAQPTGITTTTKETRYYVNAPPPGAYGIHYLYHYPLSPPFLRPITLPGACSVSDRDYRQRPHQLSHSTSSQRRTLRGRCTCVCCLLWAKVLNPNTVSISQLMFISNLLQHDESMTAGETPRWGAQSGCTKFPRIRSCEALRLERYARRLVATLVSTCGCLGPRPPRPRGPSGLSRSSSFRPSSAGVVPS